MYTEDEIMGSAMLFKVSFNIKYMDVIQTKGILKDSCSSQGSNFTVVTLGDLHPCRENRKEYLEDLRASHCVPR